MGSIELINVTKKFDNKVVINDLSCVFEEGKIYGIVGSNGCGKSVLFKLISGLMMVTEGKIIVNSVSVGKNGAMPVNLGLLIETPGFLSNLTGMENLEQLASINNIISKKEIEDVLGKVGLHNDMNTKVKNYSLGMLQRLGIAQALMEKPKILLLDEPFNSMDYEGVQELRNVIKEYVKEKHSTMLITSHNREDIDVMADEVFTLKAGKLI